LLSPGLFFTFAIIFTQTVGLLGQGISSSQGRYLHTRQHIHRINAHTDIHALSRIRTDDPSVRASEDSSCLRPRGHCGRPFFNSHAFLSQSATWCSCFSRFFIQFHRWLCTVAVPTVVLTCTMYWSRNLWFRRNSEHNISWQSRWRSVLGGTSKNMYDSDVRARTKEHKYIGKKIT
jgi:hypothetical protein